MLKKSYFNLLKLIGYVGLLKLASFCILKLHGFIVVNGKKTFKCLHEPLTIISPV